MKVKEYKINLYMKISDHLVNCLRCYNFAPPMQHFVATVCMNL